MSLSASLVGTRGTGTGNTATTGSGTSSTANVTFAALVSWDVTAGTITTRTDNKGNTYTPVGTPQADTIGGQLQWFVCQNGTGGTGHTFTFTTANPSYPTVHLIQIVSTVTYPVLDRTVQGQDTVGLPWDALATGTLTQAIELILGGCAGQGGAAAYTSGNGTILSQEPDVSSYWTSAVSLHAVTSTASYSPSFSKSDAGGSTKAGLAHITFYEAAGGGGGLVVNPMTGIGGAAAHPLAA